MSRRRGLSAEDEALWRRVVATITPLPAQSRPPPVAAPSPPAAKAARALETARPVPQKTPAAPSLGELRLGARAAPEPGWTLRPAASLAPADRGGEKRVRRGRLEIHDSLDLHGMTQAEARKAVGAFLALAAGQGGRVVIVITGKGGRLASGDAAPGVLKRRLPDWLADRRDLVAGYAQAHRRHGGEGAFYVFLKRFGEPVA